MDFQQLKAHLRDPYNAPKEVGILFGVVFNIITFGMLFVLWFVLHRFGIPVTHPGVLIGILVVFFLVTVFGSYRKKKLAQSLNPYEQREK